MPERRKSSRNAELSSFLTFHLTKVLTVTGIGRVLVAKRRIVVSFRFVSGLRVSKVSTVTGIGAVLVAKRRTVVIVGVVLRLHVFKVSTVTGIARVVASKRRVVVTFAFVSGLFFHMRASLMS